MDAKLTGKLQEIQGELIKMWGSLKGSEIEKARGNLVAIRGILQEKFGEARNEAEKQLGDMVAKYAQKPAETLEEFKAKAEAAVRKVNERLESFKDLIKQEDITAKATDSSSGAPDATEATTAKAKSKKRKTAAPVEEVTEVVVDNDVPRA